MQVPIKLFLQSLSFTSETLFKYICPGPRKAQSTTSPPEALSPPPRINDRIHPNVSPPFRGVPPFKPRDLSNAFPIRVFFTQLSIGRTDVIDFQSPIIEPNFSRLKSSAPPLHQPSFSYTFVVISQLSVSRDVVAKIDESASLLGAEEAFGG